MIKTTDLYLKEFDKLPDLLFYMAAFDFLSHKNERGQEYKDRKAFKYSNKDRLWTAIVYGFQWRETELGERWSNVCNRSEDNIESLAGICEASLRIEDLKHFLVHGV